ncbi:eukaryotic translation initiation factor 2-alpha kinase [Achlya hypogyna]|uniref:non-specific serine/threonine protein kinase n=1 Tax=Achlya hypogyna TaxID=1202772 RepID=A0A1V9Z3A3_ACHHY|nr:eukaryotic translation initiation factor 2-alpha kinase [Achlya hypogyna]
MADAAAGAQGEGSLATTIVRDRAILLAGHVSGQLVAFDAWTGEIINSIDSGGPLVANCRADSLHPRTPRSIAETKPSTDVALASSWSAEHSFLPNLANGGLFHYEKSAKQWKQVALTTDELLMAKSPLRARGNPELDDVVFVAEKAHKLFTFDADTGNLHPFFSPDAPPVVDNDDSRLLLGRVDVTTKMVNAFDTTDFKCVTVSEFFVQFASHATCAPGVVPTRDRSPWIDVQGAGDHTTLSSYDPDTHALLWSVSAPDALTMVYGLLPQYGVGFYDWSVGAALTDAGACADDNGSSADAVVAADLDCDAPVATDLVVGRVAGQMYLLPTAPPKRSSPKSINFTRRRPWQSVVVDGKQGVFIAASSVLWLAVAAVSTVLGVVLAVFWRRAAQPPETTSPAAKPLQSPPLFRQRTDSDLPLLTMSPGRLQRSVSFGGFPLEAHGGKWKGPAMPELKLGHRLSADDSEVSQRSALSETRSAPSEAPRPDTTTTTVFLDDDLRKVLPYICRGRFANEFDELSVLGKGGFGQVMLAENRLDGRRYAVKRIGLCLQQQTKETLEKFLREVKILARLDHSYIVRYYQAWLEELGEADAVSVASSDEYSMSSTRDYSRGNILRRRPSSSSGDDNAEMDNQSPRKGDSCDSLFAPRLVDADDGFEWDRSATDDDADDVDSAPWSESDLTPPPHEPRSAMLDTLRTTDDARIDHWLYIQMQYCSAQSLAEVLAAPARVVDVPHVLQVFFQIASALEHVHSLGLIHRDLKPANIFVMDAQVQTIKLGDFGLSRYAGTDAAGDSAVVARTWTNENTAGVGTYLYASPEQISGELYDAKADLYSLGIILFELGHAPFGTAMERIVTLRAVREGNVPATWLPDCPDVVHMVKRLLSTTPAERPTAKDVVTWCQATLKRKRRHDNVHVLTVEATPVNEPAVYHTLLLTLCEVVRATSASVAIAACGLKQHSTRGQLLELSLQADDDTDLDDVVRAILAVDGVANVNH